MAWPKILFQCRIKCFVVVFGKLFYSFYSNASVYVYTAPEEDFGMGVVEAMACATPVVAWDAAGPSKIIKNGKTGLLAKPYVNTDFVDKIQKVIAEKNVQQQYVQKRLTAYYQMGGIGLNVIKDTRRRLGLDKAPANKANRIDKKER